MLALPSSDRVHQQIVLTPWGDVFAVDGCLAPGQRLRAFIHIAHQEAAAARRELRARPVRRWFARRRLELAVLIERF